MSKEIDNMHKNFREKIKDFELRISSAQKNLDGFKLVYNALAKQLSTIKKMPD